MPPSIRTLFDKGVSVYLDVDGEGADSKWTSMAVASDGSYGIPEGLIYSFPVRTKGDQYQIVQGLSVDEFSRARMEATQKELGEERDAVAEILG